MRAYLLGGLVAVAMTMTAGTAGGPPFVCGRIRREQAIKLTGKVTKVEWTNPHVWFYFNVKDEKTVRSPTGAPRWVRRTCCSAAAGAVTR
jgi:hypothetical protein